MTAPDTPRIIPDRKVRTGHEVRVDVTDDDGHTWEYVTGTVTRLGARSFWIGDDEVGLNEPNTTVYLINDATTEDVSFSISSAAEMFTDPTEDSAYGGQDRAPDGSRIVEWITDDRYVDEFGCVWKAPTEDPAPTYEEMWRDMLRERDALAATLERVRELCKNTDGDWLDPEAELPVGVFQEALLDGDA